MKKEALDLFVQNYNNEGLCKDLDKFIKTFEKEFKKLNTVKTISYLPWAVVERIFRMQGGKIEVVEWVNQVEFDFIDMVPREDGTFEMAPQKKHALFIHLRAEWQGETEDEFYPLFDNQNAKIIQTPDALDLNTAKQRGMVRLIARLSGIGLWIFEQQDTQFGDDDNPQKLGEKTTIKIEEKKDELEKKYESEKPEKPKSTRQKKAAQDVAAQKDALKQVVEPQPEEENCDAPIEPEVFTVSQNEEAQNNTGFIGEFLTGKSVAPSVAETPIEIKKQESAPTKEESFGKDSEQYAEVLMEIRSIIRNNNCQAKAKAFVTKKNKSLLSELTYTELGELRTFLQ